MKTASPRKHLFLRVAGFGILAALTAAHAQTAVDITSDSHYHLLLKNDRVRVFEVSLRQPERAMVRHEHNFLVITLTDSDMVMWPEGFSDVQSYRFGVGDVRFFFGGRAIGLRSNLTTEYRNITVEFMDAKVTTYGYQSGSGEWDYGASVVRAPVDPRAKFSNSIDLGAATVSDVQLLQSDTLPKPDKPSAELLVPVTDMDLKAESDIHIRKSPGEVLWLDPGRKADLRNVDTEPARFVVIEIPVKPGD